MNVDFPAIIRAFETHDWIGLLLLALVLYGRQQAYDDARAVIRWLFRWLARVFVGAWSLLLRLVWR